MQDKHKQDTRNLTLFVFTMNVVVLFVCAVLVDACVQIKYDFVNEMKQVFHYSCQHQECMYTRHLY